jgi:hypothetical protein
METVVFIVVAIGLYVVADRVLDRVETSLGRRLENRALIFFVLLLGLAVVTFAILRQLLPR